MPNIIPHCAHGDLVNWRTKTLKGVVESGGGGVKIELGDVLSKYTRFYVKEGESTEIFDQSHRLCD